VDSSKKLKGIQERIRDSTNTNNRKTRYYGRNKGGTRLRTGGAKTRSIKKKHHANWLQTEDLHRRSGEEPAGEGGKQKG